MAAIIDPIQARRQTAFLSSLLRCTYRTSLRQEASMPRGAVQRAMGALLEVIKSPLKATCQTSCRKSSQLTFGEEASRPQNVMLISMLPLVQGVLFKPEKGGSKVKRRTEAQPNHSCCCYTCGICSDSGVFAQRTGPSTVLPAAGWCTSRRRTLGMFGQFDFESAKNI